MKDGRVHGGEAQSFTRSMCGALPIPTVTASATCPGSPRGSSTSKGLGWTRSGSRRSTHHLKRITAMTSPTTSTSTRSTGLSRISTSWWQGPTTSDSRSWSTSSRTTPQISTAGFKPPFRGRTIRIAPGTTLRTASLTALHQTIGSRPSAGRHGRRTFEAASGTCTCSRLGNRI